MPWLPKCEIPNCRNGYSMYHANWGNKNMGNRRTLHSSLSWGTIRKHFVNEHLLVLHLVIRFNIVTKPNNHLTNKCFTYTTASARTNPLETTKRLGVILWKKTIVWISAQILIIFISKDTQYIGTPSLTGLHPCLVQFIACLQKSANLAR